MQKPLIAPLLGALLCAGCSQFAGDFRPDAGGQEGLITVVIDSMLWKGAVGETLRATIGGPIATLPSREPHFVLDPVHLVSQRDLETAMGLRNVLFVGIIGDTTSNESQWLYHRFAPEVLDSILSGTPVVISRDDEWRRRQSVHYVAAANPEDLVDAIVAESENIIYSFNLVSRVRMHRELFDIGRQRDIESYLMDKHGFAVNVQHDFVIATDTSNFVWLRRILSDTWRSLFVYYEEGMDPLSITEAGILRRRNILTRQYMEGSQGGILEVVPTQPITSELMDFTGRRALEVRGLWEMVGEENGRRFQMGMGGAFLTYAFYDPPTQRMYMIDGMVFAPGYGKREFLRQLEVIAYTFRTHEDEKAEAD